MKLNPLFCNGAVMQCEKPVRVFGTGKGTVSVSFMNESKTVESFEENWCVELGSHPASGPYTMEIDLNGSKTTLHDIMIGEVILCSGQSNIELKISEAKDDFVYESNPLLRLFTVRRPEEGEYFTDEWVFCEKSKVQHWSAIAYHVGRMIRKEKNCAVGVIACYQGASVIQSWTDENLLYASEYNLPAEVKHQDHRIYPWNGDGFLFRTMFQTLVPYSLRCVIWYQGESNTSVAEASIYNRLLSLMVSVWREQLKDKCLPFVIVQIHTFDLGAPGWKELQNAQIRATKDIPVTIPVISIDLGEHEKIHPVFKMPVSERIFQAVSSLIRE